MRRSEPAQGAFGFLAEMPGDSHQFPWGEVDRDLAWHAITAWCLDGYAITFGATSDGGAIGVHLVANGNVRKHYFNDVDRLEAFLERLRTVPRTK